MQPWLLCVVSALYTTDLLCIQSRCVNPVFPGVRALGNDFLAEQEQRAWTCDVDSRARDYLDFCKHIVSYPFALPADSTKPTVAVIQEEDNKALKSFFQHLSAIGLEPWEFRDPRDDPCAESVAQTVCFAHFPTCNEVDNTAYLRPCQSTCQNYVQACSVECCDESVQCVFDKSIARADGTQVVESGFVAHDAPSPLCTGIPAGTGGLGLVWVAALLAVRSPRGTTVGLLAMLALQLQGCLWRGREDADPDRVASRVMGEHRVGNWRSQPDLSLDDTFTKPDGTVIFDSCSDPHIDSLSVCSGRGVCEMWEPMNIRNPMGFCRCEQDWAGPECRHRRKSQGKAFLLSLFFGMLGLDLFYLELYKLAILKFVTFGGCGMWWMLDIVRMGVGPPYARAFRASHDLPKWAFVVISAFVATTLGFAVFAFVLSRHLRRKRAPLLEPSPLMAPTTKSRPNEHLEKVAHLLSKVAQPVHF